jgi:hypothetical protein
LLKQILAGTEARPTNLFMANVGPDFAELNTDQLPGRGNL